MRSILVLFFCFFTAIQGFSAPGTTAIEVCGEYKVTEGQAPRMEVSFAGFGSYKVYLLTSQDGAASGTVIARQNVIKSLKLGQLYCVKGYFDQLPTRALVLYPISAKEYK